ncbi:hypothetical protein, partial [Flavobacterium zhairuonense]|uniref:hypothetical protein n=1 Tax=Flavobacterium zhairuonense TaxID=2493631 RepID=UPI001ABF1588
PEAVPGATVIVLSALSTRPDGSVLISVKLTSPAPVPTVTGLPFSVSFAVRDAVVPPALLLTAVVVSVTASITGIATGAFTVRLTVAVEQFDALALSQIE